MKRTICSMLIILSITALYLTGCGSPKVDTVETAAGWDSIVVATSEQNQLFMSDFMYFLRSSQTEVETQLIQSGQYTESNVGEFWKEEEDGVNMESMLKEQALVDAAHFKNLLKIANDAGTQVNTEIAGSSETAIEEEVSSLDPDPAKAAQLFFEAYGITPDQMKRIYMEMDIINQYLMEISTTAEFEESELRARYNENPDAYNLVTVRHVLVSCDNNMTAEKQQEAKEKADEILAMAQDGQDMGQLAAEYSEDGGSKDNNGEYTFGRGQMVTEFEDWAFSAKEGDLGIVKTTYGYHIMQMIKHFEFDDLKNDIGYQLADELVDQIINDSMNAAETDWTPEDDTLKDVRI